jgi:putative ABC transport system permease protein
MLKSYFRIAWRNLRRNKGYSFINIAGLSAGMAIALLIGLWIADELNFDHYSPRHSRLAELMLKQAAKGQEASVGPTISTAIEPVLRKGYADLFKRMAVISWPGDHLLAVGDKQVSGSGSWAQYQLPEMFSFRMIHGAAASLKDPSSLLLSQSLAVALFGKTDPVGNVLLLDNKERFRVGGVYEDLPANTTFTDCKLLLPYDNKQVAWLNSNTNWDDHSARLYMELADNVTPEQATGRIRDLPTPYIKEWDEHVLVYPMDRMHLHGEFRNGKAEGGRIQFVWLFGVIGVFVLLLACINFMNLSTARSEQRAREVGIRKTVGSLRSQLIGQFLGESVLVALLAFVLGVVLAWVTLPFFNDLSAKEMRFPWGSLVFWPLAFGFTLLTGLLAGSYPAFYLSGFDAVRVLKGAFRAGRSATRPREVLVVVQFTVSLTLIISTLIIYRQIGVARNRPVGYKEDGLLTVNINTDTLRGHYDALRADLLRTGVVADMAESSQPTTIFGNNNTVTWEGEDPSKKGIFFRNITVTPDFGATIGWTVQQGRDFSRDFPTDSDAVILNEEAARFIGWKDPVGRSVTIFDKSRPIIGVVKNMLTNNPYERIEPAVFLGRGWLGVITIRIRPGIPVHTALAGLESVFKRYNPGSPFFYKFNDEEFARKFATEQRIGGLAAVFAGLAIFISCLGLFGLASFVAEQRTREIGVRKVLGAGIVSLWALLSRDFVKLSALSIVIAIPLAYYAMHKWLQGFAFRTALSWWIFACAGAGILLITLLTVSFQSLKAAMMNPVKSLRSE